MLPKEYERFTDLHKDGKLLPPSEPGAVLAGAVLKAPKEWSGEFKNWNDEDCLGVRLGVEEK